MHHIHVFVRPNGTPLETSSGRLPNALRYAERESGYPQIFGTVPFQDIAKSEFRYREVHCTVFQNVRPEVSLNGTNITSRDTTERVSNSLQPSCASSMSFMLMENVETDVTSVWMP